MSKDKNSTLNHVPHLIKQTFFSLLIGFTIFLFLYFLSLSIFQLIFINKIFPGVHLDGIDVGGLTAGEAAVLLTQSYKFSDSGSIPLIYLDEKTYIEPEHIGVGIDAVSSAIYAFQFGRSLPVQKLLFQQVLIFAPHIEVAPILFFDEQKAYEALIQISSERDRPMKNARLEIEGTQVTAQPSQKGYSLDVDTSIENIKKHLENPSPAGIYLEVNEIIPTMVDASGLIPITQEILNQPFIIETPDGEFTKKTWEISPEDLAPMLQFESSGSEDPQIVPQISEIKILELLSSISVQVNSPAENPRFIFNDDTRELDLVAKGKQGYTINVIASVKEIQNTLAEGGHKTLLIFDYQPPNVSDSSTAQDLGIFELVHQESSYFYGSDPARIQNIETAAGQFHGLLIAPGETFSMANSMDDISLDNGYSEALIIFNGKTIEGVGGGVCQVSTTLFRTAFFTGFPIIERHPHAYRVSYYEKVSGNKRDSNLAGLDATVYIPLIDLKFTNDTPDWLLMETYVYQPESRLTWKFYSKSDGRVVNWSTTGLTSTVEPKKPIYELNQDLDPGEIKQVDWEAQGADVSVSRSVYRNEEFLFEDTFFTRYEPWRAVYEYGPGTEGIPEQNTD